MQRVNPQIAAIALLVKKFGERIAGGGYEVRVTFEDMAAISSSPQAVFQEIPDPLSRTVRWQFFPNDIIDIAPEDFKVIDTPEGDGIRELADTPADGSKTE